MFSWNARKALKNSAKHGVPFEEASTIFSDPDGLDWEDLEHAQSEPVAQSFVPWKLCGLAVVSRPSTAEFENAKLCATTFRNRVGSCW